MRFNSSFNAPLQRDNIINALGGQYSSSGTQVCIKIPLLVAYGYRFYFMIITGYQASVSASGTSVTFMSSFYSAPQVVSCDGNSAQGNNVYDVMCYSPTTTGFSMCSQSQASPGRWMASGVYAEAL